MLIYVLIYRLSLINEQVLIFFTVLKRVNLSGRYSVCLLLLELKCILYKT